MSPLTLRLLLDVHDSPAHPDLPTPAHREAMSWLMGQGMVETVSPDGTDIRHLLTERATAYLEHIRMLPLPHAVWVCGQAPLIGVKPK